MEWRDRHSKRASRFQTRSRMNQLLVPPSRAQWWPRRPKLEPHTSNISYAKGVCDGTWAERIRSGKPRFVLQSHERNALPTRLPRQAKQPAEVELVSDPPREAVSKQGQAATQKANSGSPRPRVMAYRGARALTPFPARMSMLLPPQRAPQAPSSPSQSLKAATRGTVVGQLLSAAGKSLARGQLSKSAISPAVSFPGCSARTSHSVDALEFPELPGSWGLPGAWIARPCRSQRISGH
jgi:hypothetical protein